MKFIATTGLVMALVVVLGASARADDLPEKFKDPSDGHFDLSEWLDSAYGFIPLVSVITEPAVGLGLAAGLVFVQRPREDVGKPLTSPPTMYGVGGFYTENKSGGGAAGYVGHWRKDTIRYTGGAGVVSINLTYYPPELSEQGTGFGFNVEGGGLVQRAEFRVKDTGWFVGAEYLYLETTATFDAQGMIPGLEGSEFKFKNGGLGPMVVYDNRDNSFTTNHGVFGRTKTDFYAPAFGADDDFITGKVYALGWLPVRRVVCGLRLDFRYSNGETPFYMKPYVDLRGVPAMRYQDQYTAVIETEERWNVTERWALDGFAGLGKAYGEGIDFSDAELVWTVGGGFRYQLARMYGLYGGIDVARGPEQWALYIVVGQWWSSL